MDLIYDCKNIVGDGTPCEKRNKVRSFEELSSVRCRKCGHEQSLPLSESFKNTRVLDQCPICQKKNFYIQRDFPQQAGCLVVLIGACLVPWTYGLSLAVVAVLDFILYKSLANITVCYHCLSKVRGSKPNPHHKPFDHNLFEYYS